MKRTAPVAHLSAACDTLSTVDVSGRGGKSSVYNDVAVVQMAVWSNVRPDFGLCGEHKKVWPTLDADDGQPQLNVAHNAALRVVPEHGLVGRVEGIKPATDEDDKARAAE
jgi:hypothetical protein